MTFSLLAAPTSPLLLNLLFCEMAQCSVLLVGIL